MRRWLLLAGLLVVLVALAATVFTVTSRAPIERNRRLMEWLRSPQAHADWSLQSATRCANAPFILPTNGLVGFIWDDSFRPGHRHQGLDIFGGTAVNITPVIAAYPGYLSRLQDWKSSLIIRIPSDPLQPDRQIWTYYTHMADSQGRSFISPAFPPGTQEVYVPAGTLLGYQGNYSGDPGNPVGVHLHFSIVKDSGKNWFLNELKIENTLDPSPYFGLPMNANQNPDGLVVCQPQRTQP